METRYYPARSTGTEILLAPLGAVQRGRKGDREFMLPFRQECDRDLGIHAEAILDFPGQPGLVRITALQPEIPGFHQSKILAARFVEDPFGRSPEMVGLPGVGCPQSTEIDSESVAFRPGFSPTIEIESRGQIQPCHLRLHAEPFRHLTMDGGDRK